MMSGVRLSDVWVMSEVLARCIDRVQTISVSQAETPIRPRPGCTLQLE